MTIIPAEFIPESTLNSDWEEITIVSVQLGVDFNDKELTRDPIWVTTVVPSSVVTNHESVDGIASGSINGEPAIEYFFGDKVALHYVTRDVWKLYTYSGNLPS